MAIYIPVGFRDTPNNFIVDGFRDGFVDDFQDNLVLYGGVLPEGAIPQPPPLLRENRYLFVYVDEQYVLCLQDDVPRIYYQKYNGNVSVDGLAEIDIIYLSNPEQVIIYNWLEEQRYIHYFFGAIERF